MQAYFEPEQAFSISMPQPVSEISITYRKKHVTVQNPITSFCTFTLSVSGLGLGLGSGGFLPGGCFPRTTFLTYGSVCLELFRTVTYKIILRRKQPSSCCKYELSIFISCWR